MIEHMPTTLKKAKAWAVDYAHLIKGATVMYLRHTPPKHYLGYVKEGKTPIIILPGIFGRWAFLKPLADNLSLQGHPVYIVPKLGNNIGDIPSSAQKVKEVIVENNLKHVVIVAHSKGGLIAKYLIAHDNAHHEVAGLVAIATPFSGSAIGKLVPHYSIRELDVDSEIIKYLSVHKTVNHKIISIIPLYDNHVWHDQGSFLDGALENIRVSTSGHHKVLNDKQVWREVEAGVEKLSQQ